MPRDPRKVKYDVDLSNFLDSHIAIMLGFLTIIPPLAIYLHPRALVPDSLMKMSTILILLSIILFLTWIGSEWRGDPDADVDTDALENIEVEDDVWKVEYQTLGEEIRYRDSIVINASYFSLAVLALLANLLIIVESSEIMPMIATLGMYVAFAFAVAVEQKIVERDTLRERQKTIEEGSSGKFASQTTITSGYSQRFFHPFNLSRHAIDFHRFTLFLWIIAYIILSTNEIWGWL